MNRSKGLRRGVGYELKSRLRGLVEDNSLRRSYGRTQAYDN